jgi:hypothetical protein
MCLIRSAIVLGALVLFSAGVCQQRDDRRDADGAGRLG